MFPYFMLCLNILCFKLFTIFVLYVTCCLVLLLWLCELQFPVCSILFYTVNFMATKIIIIHLLAQQAPHLQVSFVKSSRWDPPDGS